MNAPHDPFVEPFESRLFFNRRPGKIALALTGWTVIAIIGTTTAFIAFQGDNFGDWLWLFKPMIVYYYMWAMLSVGIYQLVMRVEWSASNTPWIILTHAGFLLAITLSMPFIVHLQQWRDWLYGERAVGFHFLGLFIYLFILVSCHLLKSYRIARAQERRAKAEALRASMLENQLSIAQMDVLKTQINPHFLFNALNSVAALIETDKNQQAYQAVELLGTLLRSTLDQSRTESVKLSRELEFIGCYFELEKIRYGERLNYQINAAPKCIEYDVPSLLLQPLVENTIKHAVACSHDPVTVWLDVSCDQDYLKIVISDDGSGFDEIPRFKNPVTDSGNGHGLGLINIQQRLQLLFDDRYQLTLRNRTPCGAQVEISLPIKSEPA